MRKFEPDRLKQEFNNSGFIEISSVFTMPKRIWTKSKGRLYENYYPMKYIHLNQTYYLRSYGTSFCITPIDLYTEKKIAVFSYGRGLYRETEKDILLAEASSTTREFIFDLEVEIYNKLLKTNNTKFEMKKDERFGKYWLNVSVMPK